MFFNFKVYLCLVAKQNRSKLSLRAELLYSRIICTLEVDMLVRFASLYARPCSTSGHPKLTISGIR